VLQTAVKKCVDLMGGISRFVKPGNSVLLKPNLLGARQPEKRITTDPSFVKAVAKIVLDEGGIPIIGDSPAIESFKRVAAKTGMALIAEELGIKLVELKNPTLVRLSNDSVFKNIEIASQALEADVVINLPKLKTHSQMLLTLGVKNLFGTVVAQRKAEWHHMAGVDRDTFASLLLDIYRAVKPELTIMDGIWGMEGHGPANGEPRQLNLIMASIDPVAMDMVICHLLGVPARSFPLYRAAKARGIGETDMNNIDVKGEQLDSLNIKDFKIPTLDSLGILPDRFDWFTKRFLVSKPVQDSKNCKSCGQCEEICPANVMELQEKNIVIDYDNCIRCYCCQEICPEDAIQFKKGGLVKLLNLFHR
jgi:uncharacterized protein (DUF362 family)/Pyruvate/2-oxoacid:ferredoxin oxidoreductase delta subunit